MKRIYIHPEYCCSPLWIYDESGILVENGLTHDLMGIQGLSELLDCIAEKFNGFFIDDESEFSFVEPTNDEKATLNELLDDVYSLIRMSVGDQFEISVKYI